MGVLSWNGAAYPAPRTDRRGPPPGNIAAGDPAASLLAALPQVENIAYKLSIQGANLRTREVSRALVGPAVIDTATMWHNLPEEGVEVWWTIAVTPTPEDELDRVAEGANPATAGTTVWTQTLRNTVGFTDDPEVAALMGFVPGVSGAGAPVTLRKPVFLPEFYLSFELKSTSVNRVSCMGSVRVLTALTPDLILNFL